MVSAWISVRQIENKTTDSDKKVQMKEVSVNVRDSAGVELQPNSKSATSSTASIIDHPKPKAANV